MKKRLYLRVAENSRSYIADASFKPNQAPLYRNVWKHGGNQRSYLPTVHFAINVDIPNEAFAEAGQLVADINLKLGEQLGISADVAELEDHEENNNVQ